MADVTISLNGRSYRLECGEGEEAHLLELSELVGERLGKLQKQFGQVGDDRLLLMTALMFADELTETEKKLSAAEEINASADESIKLAETKVANEISAVAGRIEVLNSALDDDEAGSGKD